MAQGLPMTDHPKDDDDALENEPSIHGSDSATDLADIHLAPSADNEQPDAEPSSADLVPSAGADEVPPYAVETIADDDARAPQSVTNPFDGGDLHEDPSSVDVNGSSTSALGVASAGFGTFRAGDVPVETTAGEGSTAAAVTPAAATSGGQLNMLLVTWASLATLTALYLWWTRPDYPSNLDTIPDDGTLQSMLLNKGKVSPLSALDERLVLPLHQTRRFGNLEVTPLGVEHRRVSIITADGQRAYDPVVLALRLRVKNAGGNQAFAPSDPAFTSFQGKSTTARAKNTMRVKNKVVFEDGYTYTFAHPVSDVESMEKRILPLAVEYGQRERVAEQKFPVLNPGESAEVLLLSQEDSLVKVKGTMLWRVKLRKGRTAKGLGAAVVIGVPFSKDNVVMTAPAPSNRLDG